MKEEKEGRMTDSTEDVLPREICVADVFDVGGRSPERVDEGGQFLLHGGEGQVDVGSVEGMWSGWGEKREDNEDSIIMSYM